MRRIGVVTGTRAEYGILYWLLKEIEAAKGLSLELYVTGSHLSDTHGKTIDSIRKDGFSIAAEIPLPLEDDSARGVGAAMAAALAGFSSVFAKNKPDLLVLLGDRYEMFAAGQAALIHRIPMAHLHGGERTEGAMDEAFRHGLTKMSLLHFTAHKEYSRRVVQLGEDPKRVFCVGTLGLDHLDKTPFLERMEWEKAAGFSLGEQNFLITHHPTTLSEAGALDEVKELLAALDAFPQAHILITHPNADTGGNAIASVLRAYAEKHTPRCRLLASLGSQRYFSALALFDVVIGNSSSGLVEAPALRTPTVDIGDRQKGRLRAPSVLHAAPKRREIERAIKKALSPAHAKLTQRQTPPYQGGGVARKVTQKLLRFPLKKGLQKAFYDLDRSRKLR